MPTRSSERPRSTSMRCVWTSLLFASAALWGTSRTQEETRWATVRRYDNGECLGEPSYVSREDDSCHPMPTEAGNANYRSFLVQYDCDRLEERAFFYCTDDDCQDCVKPSWSLSEPGQCHGGESSSWEHVCPDTILAQGPEDHALILHFDNSDCAGRPDRAITEGICTPCPFQGHDRCSGMSHLLVQYDCGDANGQHQVLFCEDASCESCREADAMSLDNVAPNQCSSSSAREASWQIICSNSRVSSTPRVHGETVFFDNEDCTGRVRRLTVDGVCNVLPTSIRENLPPRVNLSSLITYYDCEVDPSVSDEEWADSHYIIACQDDDCQHCSNTSLPLHIPRPGICFSNDGILGIMHLCPDNDTGEVVIPASTQDQGSSGSSSGDSGISVGAFVGGLIGGIMGGLLLGATGMAYAAKRNHALVTRLLAEGESSSPPPSVAMVVPPPPLDQNPGAW